MNITFACCQCGQTTRALFTEESTAIECRHCGERTTIPPQAMLEGHLTRCLVCPCRELFVRKNFSQRLGIGIIVAGFIASSITWFFYMQYLTYAILGATALADVAIYFLVGDLVQCYRCRAEYRGVTTDDHVHFSLETHEKYRQESARLGQQQYEKQKLNP